MRALQRSSIFSLSLSCLLAGFLQTPGLTAEVNKPVFTPIACPANVEELIILMLPDIPGYANRIGRRSRSLENYKLANYVILAGRPEFQPLPTSTRDYNNQPEIKNDLQQVFITTLERQYSGDYFTDLQHYHWLFLARTQTGWYLAMMFSRLGVYPQGDPPSPPRESSHGIVGQGIETWLTDCNAGAIRKRTSNQPSGQPSKKSPEQPSGQP